MFDIACVGILVADVICKTVDKMPERGKLGILESIKLYSGGCAMSAAVDISKIGAKTALLGMIGYDTFGEFLESELQKHGVDIGGLKTSEQAGTSASAVLVDGGGERTFLHTLGANAVFSEADIDYSIIEKSRIVFVAGAMLMPKFDGADMALMLKKSKQMGKITALDTAWDDKGRWMSVLRPCMPYIDYFLPSIEEARMLSGENEPERIADYFFEMGVSHVVIKLGKDGCYVRETREGDGLYIPTYNHIKAVDTTGAGDSFCAGFLFGLSHSMSMLDCCRLANATATHCVMETGASKGIKSYQEIKQFMEQN